MAAGADELQIDDPLWRKLAAAGAVGAAGRVRAHRALGGVGGTASIFQMSRLYSAMVRSDEK